MLAIKDVVILFFEIIIFLFCFFESLRAISESKIFFPFPILNIPEEFFLHKQSIALEISSKLTKSLKCSRFENLIILFFDLIFLIIAGKTNFSDCPFPVKLNILPIQNLLFLSFLIIYFSALTFVEP